MFLVDDLGLVERGSFFSDPGCDFYGVLVDLRSEGVFRFVFVSFLVQSFSILIETPVDIRNLTISRLVVGIAKYPLGCNLLLVNDLHLYLFLLQFLAVFYQPVLYLADHLLGDPSAVPVDLGCEVVLVR